MKWISYIISSIFGVFFLFILLFFHLLQVLMRNLGGYAWHKKSVDYLNFCLTKSLLLLGIRVAFENQYTLKEDQVYIFVSNHQSMFEIPALGWYFRKHHPKFVSKIELAKGYPSISYNLRHGGAVLIDRKDGSSAVSAIKQFAKKLKKNKWSAVIFPEGTRSRTGKPKPFAVNGVRTIIAQNPDAYIVPISINNFWHIFKYGSFPLGLGKTAYIKTHQPIAVNSLTFDDLMQKVEQKIINEIFFEEKSQ